MEITYIKREEFQIEMEKLNKKYKGKYRFKARASAPYYLEHIPDGSDSFSAWSNVERSKIMLGEWVYPKTKKGAEISAITKLLQQCRPPLTKKQKLENRSTRNKDIHTRNVNVEVRVSNALDFIMNDGDEKQWHEIKRETSLKISN